MTLTLDSPFLGIRLHVSAQKCAKSLYLGRGQLSKRPPRKCVCSKKRNDWMAQAVKFSHLCGKNVELLRKAISSRSVLKAECVREPLAQSKALVRSLAPLWTEGLLFVRCSVFLAVISGVCLLMWYGQTKAKAYVESNLLPSVCSVLSDYVQREISFGRVRGVSPLSITLESCSIGPHREEFSCGEVPSLKLCLHPFASLRRGKIVIDAVLSQPTVVVAQKRDYTWLGIPSFEDGPKRHLSTEEGIDFRTRTRRFAREELAARWDQERDHNAEESAEKGYVVPERDLIQPEDGSLKKDAGQLTSLANSESFSYIDEKTPLRDHHCMDTGLEYDSKHADLEKSFGVKFPGSGLQFWSGAVRGPKTTKFKRKANGSGFSANGLNSKRQVLERSASAAVLYFLGQSNEKFDKPCESSVAYDDVNPSSLWVKNENDHNVDIYVNVSSNEEAVKGNKQNRKCDEDIEVKNQKIQSHKDSFSIIRDPFLMTVGKLSENLRSIRSAMEDSKTTNLNIANVVSDPVKQCGDADKSAVHSGHEDQNSTLRKFEDKPGFSQPIPNLSPSLKSGLPSLLRTFREQLSYLLSGPIQKLTSGIGPKVGYIVSELVDEVDGVQTEGIEKMLPVSLDSVHFKGGTLMLLAYGDREPRVMENANGQVKF